MGRVDERGGDRRDAGLWIHHARQRPRRPPISGNLPAPSAEPFGTVKWSVACRPIAVLRFVNGRVKRWGVCVPFYKEIDHFGATDVGVKRTHNQDAYTVQ